MSTSVPTEPITIRTRKVSEIDALASAMARSRNYIVNQAIEHYLEANAWQMERIEAGVAAARAGHVGPAEDVFARIAETHGWVR